MADVVREIRDRLKAGGWSEKRTGKAEVWAHPNGAIYPLSTSMRDQGRTKDNALAAIARLERTGNPLVRKKVEPSPAPTPMVPVKEPKARVPEVLAETEPKPEPKLEWFTWVKNTREAASFSTDDVAGLLGAGVTGSMIRKVEAGLRRFSPDEFTAWMALFEVTVPEGLEVPLASDADMAKRRGHAQAKALGAAMHDTLTRAMNPRKACKSGQGLGSCSCPKCRMGITDWDGTGLPPTPEILTTPEADAPETETSEIPPPEPPLEAPVPADPATPVIVPEVPPTRTDAVAMVTKILSNPRLTDEEALALAKDTVSAATRVLLGL